MYDEGLELADALHLAAAREAGAGRFATFDGALTKRARRLHAADAVEPCPLNRNPPGQPRTEQDAPWKS